MDKSSIPPIENGFQRQVARTRRAERRGDQEELVPLASTHNGDVMDHMTKDENVFQDNAFTNKNGALKNGGPGSKVSDVTESGSVDNKDVRCGYFQCRPDALQQCNNPKALLLFLSFFSMAQGFVVNGINNVDTSTLERRFQLPSSRVGMVSSSYDLSAGILGVFISYMGSGKHKAKWLTFASIIMAFGSLVMALPHFTSGLYQWGQNVTLQCNHEDNPKACSAGDSELQHYLYLLVLGQLLHGLGGTTLYTVGVALIDDSVTASSSPLYIGILYAFATLGPAMGYIVGGQLLGVYVDFDQVSTSSVRIDPEDPRWVGAWWVGFLIASVLFLLSSIPISMYGSELPTAKAVRESRVSQMHRDDGTMIVTSSSESRSLRDLKYLPVALWRLFKIPPFLFITLAGASEGLITSGFATFMPKFIQNQFGVTAGWASMLTGFMAVPGAAGGQFVGGFVCNRLQLKVKGCIRVAIICCATIIVLSAALFIKCDNPKLSGIDVGYPSSSDKASLPELISDCNMDCNCHTELYEPVCDDFGSQYFSPCHAGCHVPSDDQKSYTDCACVPMAEGRNVSMVTVGKCGQNCQWLYIFLPLLFVIIFLTFMPSPPGVSATLRCIHDSQRTLGLGAKWFVVRLLGTVPGPILFGVIIDSTCVLWRDKCGEKASCWVYNNASMGRNFFILVICGKVVSIVLFTIAHQLYTPPTEKDVKYIAEDDCEKRTASVSSAFTELGDKTDRETNI